MAYEILSTGTYPRVVFTQHRKNISSERWGGGGGRIVVITLDIFNVKNKNEIAFFVDLFAR